MKTNSIFIWVVGFMLLLSSCEDFFSPSPGDMLLEEDNYSALNEVYSNYLGVITTLQLAAERYIILSELRGDLMEPTSNAPIEYWEAWRYEGTNGNEILEPTSFYNVILNANDFLWHIVNFNKEYPNTIDEKVYRGMISTIISTRAWAYLNIGKLYGEAVYYDWKLSTNNELSQQEILPLEQLVDELIHFMKNGVDGVDAFNEMNWLWVLGGSDYSWNRMTVNSNALMMELYLWSGNYIEAIREGMMMVTGTGHCVIGISTKDVHKYRLSNLYSKDNWKKIFDTFGAANDEILTAIPYDFNKGQTNNMQYWFSNIAPNVYYFKPTDLLVTNYENTVCINDAIGDSYRGKDITYRIENGKLVINRYTMNRAAHQRDASINIYRAADMYLMLCEAFNGTGDFAVVDSLLNVGLESSWSGSYFDTPFDAPIFTSTDNVLKNCLGVRGRVGVKPNYLKYFIDDSASDVSKRVVLDSLIANETALECAFEGKRWFTLLRMARNTNNPAFLAKTIAQKFPEGERATYEAKLMNSNNWFIHYDHLKVK